MKIEVTKTEQVKEVIDIEFPYYYRLDLNEDDGEYTSVIYGKKTEDEDFQIKETIRSNGDTIYEVERKVRSNCGSFFDQKHTGTREAFERAKYIANKFLDLF